jgi:hypothetical protein
VLEDCPCEAMAPHKAPRSSRATARCMMGTPTDQALVPGRNRVLLGASV